VKYKLSLSVLVLCLAALARQSEPWPASAVVAPTSLASQLKAKSAPYIFYVGFPVLFKGARIPAATFAGPCSKPEGVDLLTRLVKPLRHDADIVIYCGCCPFIRCPNVRPAFQALKDAGYTNVKVLQLDTNLHTDWVEKGYPTDK
jgi:thiosulfate/3-mercaptopyruvate sulfurtransferase